MDKKERAKINKKIERINLLLNLVWSFIFLFPLVIFCYNKMDRNWFIVSLSISVAAGFLPTSFLNAMQVSKSRKFYRGTGIEFFNRFIQNGTLLNRFIKNRFPEYKRFNTREEAFKKLFYQSYMFEKFHVILFIFFAGAMFFAILNGAFIWAAYFLFANILYNIYPILLQQYIRLRLGKFHKKKSVASERINI
jgi:hypothetical protein